MKLTPPRAVVPPAAFIPPIGRDDLEPVLNLPLREVPGRMTSAELDFDALSGRSSMSGAVDELMRKVQAEHARMLRLLPAVPEPWSWEVELESTEHVDLARSRGDVTVRLVYRLRNLETGERVDPREGLAAIWGADPTQHAGRPTAPREWGPLDEIRE